MACRALFRGQQRESTESKVSCGSADSDRSRRFLICKSDARLFVRYDEIVACNEIIAYPADASFSGVTKAQDKPQSRRFSRVR